jgi:hypothetical protein
MRRTVLNAAFAFLLLLPKLIFAEALGGGRGGPFIDFHNASLENFDVGVAGSPVVIGGVGFGWATKAFRIGGGGGGGFLWNATDNVTFGMGYGGVVGEYTISPPWLSARLMIGGGGYSIAKITSQSDTQQTVQKLSSGGFILFHPQINMEVKVGGMAYLSGMIGYFLPNVGRLHSFTMGVNIMFGKI